MIQLRCPVCGTFYQVEAMRPGGYVCRHDSTMLVEVPPEPPADAMPASPGADDDDVDFLEVVDDPATPAPTGWSDSGHSIRQTPTGGLPVHGPGSPVTGTGRIPVGPPAGSPPAPAPPPPPPPPPPGQPGFAAGGRTPDQWNESSAPGAANWNDSSAPGGEDYAEALPVDANEAPPESWSPSDLVPGGAAGAPDPHQQQDFGVNLPVGGGIPDSIRHTPIAMRRFELPKEATQGAGPQKKEPQRSIKPQVDPNREELNPGPWGEFNLLYELGRGAMGIVYCADWPKYQRKVAIKVLSTRKTQEVRHRKRFMREAQICTSLTHPNLVKVYMVDEIDGRWYMAMELIDGVTLSEVIRDQGRLQPEYVLPMMHQVLPGVQIFHNAGVIHRDIKPDNIMIRRSDNVAKVTDFGLARLVGADISKLTAAGKAVGTPYFMAPEQILQPDNVDHRVDLYACGVTLYYALTLAYPYEGRKANDVLLNIARKDPVPLTDRRGDMPRAVTELVMRMIARDPDERYQSATELAEVMGSVIRTF